MNFSDHLPALNGAVADQLCDDASWSGIAHAVRIMLDEGDEQVAVGRSSVVLDVMTLQVRVSDVPNPQEGDRAQTASRTFEVRRGSEPQKTADGTWWRCEVREL